MVKHILVRLDRFENIKKSYKLLHNYSVDCRFEIPLPFYWEIPEKTPTLEVEMKSKKQMDTGEPEKRNLENFHFWPTEGLTKRGS